MRAIQTTVKEIREGRVYKHLIALTKDEAGKLWMLNPLTGSTLQCEDGRTRSLRVDLASMEHLSLAYLQGSFYVAISFGGKVKVLKEDGTLIGEFAGNYGELLAAKDSLYLFTVRDGALWGYRIYRVRGTLMPVGIPLVSLPDNVRRLAKVRPRESEIEAILVTTSYPVEFYSVSIDLNRINAEAIFRGAVTKALNLRTEVFGTRYWAVKDLMAGYALAFSSSLTKGTLRTVLDFIKASETLHLQVSVPYALAYTYRQMSGSRVNFSLSNPTLIGGTYRASLSSWSAAGSVRILPTVSGNHYRARLIQTESGQARVGLFVQGMKGLYRPTLNIPQSSGQIGVSISGLGQYIYAIKRTSELTKRWQLTAVIAGGAYKRPPTLTNGTVSRLSLAEELSGGVYHGTISTTSVSETIKLRTTASGTRMSAVKALGPLSTRLGFNTLISSGSMREQIKPHYVPLVPIAIGVRVFGRTIEF